MYSTIHWPAVHIASINESCRRCLSRSNQDVIYYTVKRARSVQQGIRKHTRRQRLSASYKLVLSIFDCYLRPTNKLHTTGSVYDMTFLRRGPRLVRTFVLMRKNPPIYGHTMADRKLALSLSKDPVALSLGTIPQKCVTTYQVALSNHTPEEPSRLPNIELFEESPEFIAKAQTVIKDHIQDCPIFAPLASSTGSDFTMYFHIYDLRAPPPFGRIPEVEDIMGTVRVEHGKMIPESYEPNKMYRPVTACGVFTVSDYLNEKVRQACEDR
jgi:hypothetical protein